MLFFTTAVFRHCKLKRHLQIIFIFLKALVLKALYYDHFLVHDHIWVYY